MSIIVKPISSDAKLLLAALKTDPRYVSHHYDENHDLIVVTIKKWFGCGDKVKGLKTISTDHITRHYAIPYSHTMDRHHT